MIVEDVLPTVILTQRIHTESLHFNVESSVMRSTQHITGRVGPDVLTHEHGTTVPGNLKTMTSFIFQCG